MKRVVFAYGEERLTAKEWSRKLRLSHRQVLSAISRGWEIQDLVAKHVPFGRPSRAPRWTPADEATVRRMRSEGKTHQQIARVVGRSPIAIALRFKEPMDKVPRETIEVEK
ncbi:MAG: hypothetical protein AAF411_20210 [Myxococcota bacterium]